MNGAQLQPIGTASNGNFGRFNSPEATQALKEYANATDDAARTAAMNKIQKIIVEQMPMIPRPRATSVASTRRRSGSVGRMSPTPTAPAQPTQPNAVDVVLHLKPWGFLIQRRAASRVCRTRPPGRRRSRAEPAPRADRAVLFDRSSGMTMSETATPALTEVVLEAERPDQTFPGPTAAPGPLLPRAAGGARRRRRGPGLRRGRVIALVGESGSGKSTVARLLAQLCPRTGGASGCTGRGPGSAARPRPPGVRRARCR